MLRTVINFDLRPTFWKFMAHLYICLCSYLVKLPLIIYLGTIRILFRAHSVTIVILYSHLLEFLRVQFLKTILLFYLFWNWTTISGSTSSNIWNVIDFSSSNWRSWHFRCISINFPHLNHMSSALSLHFVYWVQGISCLTLEFISPRWVNVLYRYFVVWNISNSVLFQHIWPWSLDITLVHVVSSLNSPVFSIDICICSLYISNIKLVMAEPVWRFLLDLWSQQLRKSLINKSVSRLRNLSRSIPLINVELIYLRLVRDLFVLFVLMILIWAWDFAISICELTHVVSTCMACVVFTKALLVILEILVDLSIILNGVHGPIRVRRKHFYLYF